MARLDARAADLMLWNDYYENRHPLSFFDDAVRERFGARFSRFASNFCALVVDGFAERFEVQGFRFDDAQGDEDVWAIWQDNDLDAASQSAHIDAFVKCCAYALIDPNGGDPRITIEDALDTIVAHDPRDNRNRLAGLKRWIDLDGHLIVVVYLANFIFKYRSVKAWPSTQTPWLRPNPADDFTINLATTDDSAQPIASALSPIVVPAGGFERYQSPDDDEWPLTNTLGVVPLVRIANRPRISGKHVDGRSEIEPITSNQDLINYYRAMSVVAARYLAMPQRYALNLETDIDEKTGQPKPPFKAGLADLWVVPPMAEDDPRSAQAAAQVTLGQFAAADLTPYIALIKQEVGAMASISRMPYFYLTGEPTTVPPSGESLNSSEAALVRKVRSASVYLGESWEEVMRVALRAKGDSRASERQAETIWARPETRNLAVVADATVKEYTAGLIDLPLGQEQIGLSPQQQRRMSERQDTASSAASAPVVPSASATTPANSQQTAMQIDHGTTDVNL